MFKQFPKYKYVLALCDYILLALAFAAAVLTRFSDVPVGELLSKPFLPAQIVFSAVYFLIWIVIFQHFNLYKINFFLAVGSQIAALVKALIYGLIGMIVISFFIKGLDWVDSRATIAYFTAYSFLSIALFRTLVFRKIFIWASQKKILRRRVLIVGTDRKAKATAVQIELDDSHGFQIIGFVADDLPIGERVFEDLRVVGTTDDLKNLVKRFDIEEIIIAQSEISHQNLLEIIDKAKTAKATVRLVSELYDIIPEKVRLEKYIGVPVLMMPQNYDNTLFNVYKRVFDVVIASTALIVLAIPLVVIAALIRFSSKGSVFYDHTRIGKDGAPFKFHKFRTMYLNNDDQIHRDFVREYIKSPSSENGETVKKITDDPRVTPVGRFLRKTSLDELPQLFNVLRGEMSLVGPRPCLPYEWDEYESWHRRRLSVTPGCTGLWQVSGRSAVGFDDMVILDLFYIDNMSPLFDLKIIFKTIPVMLLAKGGY